MTKLKNNILVIVESPTKCNIIKKYLSQIDPFNSYTVLASYGHIRDLSKDNMGIDYSSDFKQQYTILDSKRKVVDTLKKRLKECDKVLLASDNDREGESIAWHLKEVLGLRKYSRLLFNEITLDGLRNAMNDLKDIDMDLVYAQQTRRIIDRIMGFRLSPILWKHFKVSNGTILSAGRVQSALMHLIVDKEEEIKNHVSKPYWTVIASFNIADKLIEDCKLVDSLNEKLVRFENICETKTFMKSLKANFNIVSSKIRTTRESSDPPFITSSLQQEANAKLGFSVKTTMQLAQKLYEQGLITYMRTDSYALSKQALEQIKTYITKNYGIGFFEHRTFNKKTSKHSQQAHEAIRPTNVSADVKIKDPQMRLLYDFIKNRTIASQMIPCTRIIIDVSIVCNPHLKHKDYKTLAFHGKLDCIEHPGYLMVYNVTANAKTISNFIAFHTKIIQGNISIDCQTIHAKNTWTNATSRLNEAGIVKLMEKQGIGRPSTYSSMIEKLYSKSYILNQNTTGNEHDYIDLIWTPSSLLKEERYNSTTNQEINKVCPTKIGIEIDEFMCKHFKGLIDVEFTAYMEELLDAIAEGTTNYLQVLQVFWDRLNDACKTVEHKPDKKKELAVESITFTIGDNEYNVRLGKYGPLIEFGQDKKKHFIGLKAYLKLIRKNYLDITKDDVFILTSMPFHIDNDSTINYGRYGFYITSNGESYTIPTAWIIKTLGGWERLLEIKSKHIEELKKLKKDYFSRKTTKKTLVKTSKKSYDI